jgi:hypothetical protein
VSAILKESKETAKKCLTMVFKGISEDQRLFRQAADEFKRAKVIMSRGGTPIVVIYDNMNPRFAKSARWKILQEKRRIPVVAQLNKTGFQIFGNRKVSLDKVVAGIRIAILKQRGFKKRFSKNEISKGGAFIGTEPLYYHREDYPVILWGSLTATQVDPLNIDPLKIEAILVSALK